MKRFLFLLVCIALSTNVFAFQSKKTKGTQEIHDQQLDADPVASFKSLVSFASEPTKWTRVFFHDGKKKWVKHYISLGSVKFDVKKTDSLISPAMGVVAFTIDVVSSEFFDTEQDAAQTATVSDLKVTYFYQGRYIYADKSWQTDQFSYRIAIKDAPPDRMTFTVSRDRLLREQVEEKGNGALLTKWIK